MNLFRWNCVLNWSTSRWFGCGHSAMVQGANVCHRFSSAHKAQLIFIYAGSQTGYTQSYVGCRCVLSVCQLRCGCFDETLCNEHRSSLQAVIWKKLQKSNITLEIQPPGQCKTWVCWYFSSSFSSLLLLLHIRIYTPLKPRWVENFQLTKHIWKNVVLLTSHHRVT